MQAYANSAFIAKRRKIAKWGNYIGLGALFLGLFTVSRSPVLSSTLLLIGVFGASIAAYMTSRYVREPRADQLLARAIDGLDRRYTLLSYYLPVDHVVFSHHGFTVLMTRAQQGDISFSNGRWNHQMRMRRIKQLLGEPALARPDRDLQGEITEVSHWVATQGMGENVPVSGVIVFTSDRATLNTDGLDCPAVTLKNLADFLREGLPEAARLSTSERREIESKLDELVGKA